MSNQFASELQNLLELVNPGERRITDQSTYEEYPRKLQRVVDEFLETHEGFGETSEFHEVVERWNRVIQAWSTMPLPPSLPSERYNQHGLLSHEDALELQARKGGGEVREVGYEPDLFARLFGARSRSFGFKVVRTVSGSMFPRRRK